jgi:hypothetical protein
VLRHASKHFAYSRSKIRMHNVDRFSDRMLVPMFLQDFKKVLEGFFVLVYEDELRKRTLLLQFCLDS